MKRPVIGLIPLYDDDRDSYWMVPGYMKAVESVGGLPIMLPLTTDTNELDQLFEMCDGLLLTGGHDVDPSVYGEADRGSCGISCPARDQMEGYLLDKALDTDKPVLGICRGVQFINAHMGGTLYQDLPLEYDCKVEHHMAPPYDRSAHSVEVLPDTLLSEIIGYGLHNVNSYHHQAIKKTAPGLNVMAISEDGLTEAVSAEGKSFIVGVQWHPEFSYQSSEESRLLMQAFIKACGSAR